MFSNPLELLTLLGILFNTGILTAIYYKMGAFEEKHKSHENRLTLLERQFQCGIDLKNNRHSRA